MSQIDTSKRNGATPSPASPSPNRTALPTHWYIFFGIIEPLSVMAGSVYAIFFQEKYHNELIPLDYLLSTMTNVMSSVPESIAPKSAVKALWAPARGAKFNATARAAAAKVFSKADILGPPTRMALAQLGSCYFLIMLNSALVFFALRRHLSHAPEIQERILYYFFFVLGAADWTHILLTIHFLPPAVAPMIPVDSNYNPAAPLNYFVGFLAKIVLLLRYPSAWNSLLFGNIAITLMLFMARMAWWIGIGRDTFIGEGRRIAKKPLPRPPTKKAQ